MGGGTTQIQAPEVPEAPTVTSSIEDYIKNVPELFEMSQKYQPQFAELQQQIQRQTSPLTAGLQESLAAQATEGMQAGVPDWMRKEYLSNVRSQLGQNVSSPIGADYASRGLLAQSEQFKLQNQQLALSLAGRQQLIQAPSQEQLLGGFNTGQSLGFNQGVFGTQANIYGTQANMASQQANLNLQKRGQNISMINSGMGMIGNLCWIAATVFDGWEDKRTICARKFINEDAPKWFRNLYAKFGERVAKFIENKPILKALIRPLFMRFARRGGYNA